jgi:hypothetical protein
MARYWLSYDLGLRGNYDELYRWLAEKDAKECGESAATFSAEGTVDELRKELKSIVGKKGRVYLIGRDTDGTLRGKWLFGSRRPPPWLGYASIADEDQDEA